MDSFDSHSFCVRCREKGKGSDPCTSHNDCTACNSLTEEQCLQLSMPSYRLKKEKRELKKSTDNTPQKDSDSSSLIHPSSVTVVGAVDGQGMVQSPGSSSGTKKKKSNPSDKKVSSAKHPKEKPVKSPTSNPHRSSADARIEELDQKWSDRLNRFDALLLAKTLDKPEPTFGTVKVTPTTSPPVGITTSTEPFIRPTENLQATDLAGTDHSPQKQATDKSLSSTSTK